MKKLIIVFLTIVCTLKLQAQNDNKPLAGMVSYISSQNVYVKFISTKNFKVGDTLYIQKDNTLIPVLKVNNFSSTSCVCTPISESNLSVSMKIFAKNNIQKSNEDEKVKLVIPTNEINNPDTTESIIQNELKRPRFKQKISGSISASSYSNFSNSANVNSSRFRYQFSLNAKNISNSMISAEANVTFQHEKDNWKKVQENVFQALKIYNLAVKFDNNKNTQIILGRKLNPKISSLGAIDGIQYEGKINNLYVGLIAGSRPNYTDYNFDFSLPQFGAYIGHNHSNSNGEMQNSFGVFEQMNVSKTDRRIAYYQHSNSLIKNLYLFGSFEMELYKNIDSIPKNTFDLSSTFLLLNYKLFKRITLSASYDNRKNVIYYETYKSYINQILEIEARQGLSFQANYYNLKNLTFGAKAGYRFPNKNSKETINLYAFVSFYNIPGVNLNATVSANYLETSYVSGKILNLNLSREFLQNNLYVDCGYQLVDYSYTGSDATSLQNVVNLGITWLFIKNISFSANYETSFEKQNHYNRLNLQIRKRF
jgi:hypothetical protein